MAGVTVGFPVTWTHSVEDSFAGFWCCCEEDGRLAGDWGAVLSSIAPENCDLADRRREKWKRNYEGPESHRNFLG